MVVEGERMMMMMMMMYRGLLPWPIPRIIDRVDRRSARTHAPSDWTHLPGWAGKKGLGMTWEHWEYERVGPFFIAWERAYGWKDVQVVDDFGQLVPVDSWQTVYSLHDGFARN